MTKSKKKNRQRLHRETTSDSSASPIESNSESTPPIPNRGWTPVVRWVVSAVILFHITAIFFSPFAFFIPPLETINRWFRPYQQATYTGHGYQFFAPDPGPSHIVRYEIEMKDGTQVAGQFPDRDKLWPRQYYHRWFMLSEQIHAINVLILSDSQYQEVVKDLDIQLTRANRDGDAIAVRNLTTEKLSLIDTQVKLKEQAQILTRGVDQFLRRQYPDAIDVKIWTAERLIPYPFQVVEERKSLDDPEFLPSDRQRELSLRSDDAEEIR